MITAPPPGILSVLQIEGSDFSFGRHSLITNYVTTTTKQKLLMKQTKMWLMFERKSLFQSSGIHAADFCAWHSGMPSKHPNSTDRHYVKSSSYSGQPPGGWLENGTTMVRNYISDANVAQTNT